jgi:hypothetical protein
MAGGLPCRDTHYWCQKRDTPKWRAETKGRKGASITTTFAHHMLYIRRWETGTGWLGRAESKSDQFSFCFKAHSEKSCKTRPLSINRLAGTSECESPIRKGVLPSEGRGREFESRRARQRFQSVTIQSVSAPPCG